ncbi:MAG: hypothetical protein ACOX7P_02470 [Oscillospiraceae bacterium]|jgi:hypothetical protein
MDESMFKNVVVVEETKRQNGLEVEEGSFWKAPEGKNLTMTVNGVGKTPFPGRYEGDVVLTVSDEYKRDTVRFGNAETNSFRCAVVINDGKYSPECSVPAIVQRGTVTDTEANDILIVSDEWDFNGVYVGGDGDYTINRATIILNGDGTDDFVGKGAGVAVTGTGTLTINDSTILTNGITRGAAYTGGNGTLVANDCYFRMTTYEPDEMQKKIAKENMRMIAPPWMMGIAGRGRTTNIAGMGTSYYNRCHVISDSWGVLSVDGACVNRMYVKDSYLEIKGESGYGVFAIADDVMFDYKGLGEPGCWDVIDHSLVEVPDYAIIMSNGTAGSEFKNGSIIRSKKNAALIFRNCGTLKVNSKTVVETDKTCFVVKGSNARVEVDDAILRPKNGILYTVMGNDDVGMGGTRFIVPVGQVDTPIEGRDLANADPGEDCFFLISNMETAGNIFNATTNLKPNMDTDSPMALGGPPAGERPEGMFPAPPEGAPGDAPPPIMIPSDTQVRGFLGDDLQGVKNLEIKLVNAKVTGVISSAAAKYRDGLEIITEENWQEIGNITETPAPAINNGTILSLDKDSVWIVTGTSYLTSLTIEDGAQILGAEGKAASITADGKPVAGPGRYDGKIVVSVQ